MLDRYVVRIVWLNASTTLYRSDYVEAAKEYNNALPANDLTGIKLFDRESREVLAQWGNA